MRSIRQPDIDVPILQGARAGLQRCNLMLQRFNLLIVRPRTKVLSCETNCKLLITPGYRRPTSDVRHSCPRSRWVPVGRPAQCAYVKAPLLHNCDPISIGHPQDGINSQQFIRVVAGLVTCSGVKVCSISDHPGRIGKLEHSARVGL